MLESEYLKEDARGVLLLEHWSALEPAPGNFDFTTLDNRIALVKTANQKYTLAISGGALGSPAWLTETLGAPSFSFTYQSQNWQLSLWWDVIVEERLNLLITELGDRYAPDTSLSHVYVTQRTSGERCQLLPHPPGDLRRRD